MYPAVQVLAELSGRYGIVPERSILAAEAVISVLVTKVLVWVMHRQIPRRGSRGGEHGPNQNPLQGRS